MCESCERDYELNHVNRREFIKVGSVVSGSVVAGAALLASASATAVAAAAPSSYEARPKRNGKIRVVFMYPPDQVVLDGKLEDGWASNKWYTWPGNQFSPEKNHALYRQKIKEITASLALDVEFIDTAIYTQAEVDSFIVRANADKLDGIVIVNFWNSFSKWVLKMVSAIDVPIVVYHPVGSSHQHPPKGLMEAEGVCYIHSVHHWAALEGALRSLHARTRLQQSRLLQISDYKEHVKEMDSSLGVEMLRIPANEYNLLFDSITVDDDIRAEAMAFKSKAFEVRGVTDYFLIEAFRAHRTVNEIMKRYGADAITIKCLMLGHRKPCVSFSINNSRLVTSACENFHDSAMTMMLGSLLFDRGGFMHNPDFDINRNQYFGSHCTSPLELRGPGKGQSKFMIRPFMHHLPASPALDVQFEPKERIFVTKYLPAQSTICGYTGEMIGSIDSEITGGCASRFLMDVDKLEDVCSMYQGPHPIMYYGDKDMALRLKIFTQLNRMKWIGNV